MNVYEKYRFSLRKNSVFRVVSVLNQAKGIDAFMKLINVDEECPEIFYVFIGLGSSIYSKINYHNYKLNNLLVSGGFKNLEISNIDITNHNETPGFYEQAFEVVPAEIIQNQSTGVDTVSGATQSSIGIINAVNNALNQANKTQNSTTNNNTNLELESQ